MRARDLDAIDTSALFTPFMLAGVTLPNRFVMPGMQRGLCVEGAPSQSMTDYYRRRVAGGVGLVITESVAVDHESATQNGRFARLIERTAPAWAACFSAIKAEGGHIISQLWHEGGLRPEGGDGPYARYPTLSPSGWANATRQNGRAASMEELDAIKAGFVRSARIAQQAGADGVEVHGAHGYLLDQFLWTATNRRADGYGGPAIADRVRFPAEIVAAIRAACGPGFLISFRFSQWKESDYSARVAESPDELEVMLSMLRRAGADLIHASTRRFWLPEWPESPLGLAGWCKAVGGMPVATVGSVGLNVDIMESFSGKPVEGRIREGLRELTGRFAGGEFDLVSVGRSLISDPQWVEKVRRGAYDAIRTFERADTKLPDAEIAALARARDPSR